MAGCLHMMLLEMVAPPGSGQRVTNLVGVVADGVIAIGVVGDALVAHGAHACKRTVKGSERPRERQ